MKKIFAVLMCLVFLFSNVQIAVAKDTSDELISITKIEGKPLLNSFKITSGIEKKIEYTFDSTRNIAGVAEKGTEISIKVAYYNEKEERKEQTTNLVVGKSGVFSQDISFNIGENYILITAKKNGREACITSELFCIDSNIKYELETIVFPEDKIKRNQYIINKTAR